MQTMPLKAVKCAGRGGAVRKTGKVLSGKWAVTGTERQLPSRPRKRRWRKRQGASPPSRISHVLLAPRLWHAFLLIRKYLPAHNSFSGEK